jgi:hypothetical protein
MLAISEPFALGRSEHRSRTGTIARVNRSVGLFVAFLIVLAGVVWALVPYHGYAYSFHTGSGIYSVKGRNCSAAVAEVIRNNQNVKGFGGSWGDSSRPAVDPCYRDGKRRLFTSVVVIGAGIVTGLVALLLSRKPRVRSTRRRGSVPPEAQSRNSVV